MPLAARYVCGCCCVRMSARGGGYAYINMESLTHTHARSLARSLARSHARRGGAVMHHLKKNCNIFEKKTPGTSAAEAEQSCTICHAIFNLCATLEWHLDGLIASQLVQVLVYICVYIICMYIHVTS